ncbi:hypothetical protein HUT17_03190 [Nocardiopsis flavescens]|nr:hypothetical protein HUT17_03190 [Nocardiopsis flavescens]
MAPANSRCHPLLAFLGTGAQAAPEVAPDLAGDSARQQQVKKLKHAAEHSDLVDDFGQVEIQVQELVLHGGQQSGGHGSSPVISSDQYEDHEKQGGCHSTSNRLTEHEQKTDDQLTGDCPAKTARLQMAGTQAFSSTIPPAPGIENAALSCNNTSGKPTTAADRQRSVEVVRWEDPALTQKLRFSALQRRLARGEVLSCLHHVGRSSGAHDAVVVVGRGRRAAVVVEHLAGVLALQLH